jgi:RHS repeat-associated protein
MFAWFTFRKINSTASRLSSWVSKSNTLSKSSAKGNKRRHFRTHWLSMSAIPKLWRSKRALLVVVLLASSAVALTSLGAWRAVRSVPGLAPVHSTPSGAIVAPATTNPPLTKLREYVYAGGRLIASEEKSCATTLSPPSANSPQGGGPGSFNVSTSSGCSWTATPGASWITITDGLNGVGEYIVRYSVAPNSGPQRVGTITVNGQTFTITQAPSSSSCSYSLSKTSEPVSEQGGSGFVDLTADAGCEWFASSDAGWLTIASEDTHGFGPATINYSFTANNSGEQRTTLIRIGGKTLTVTQPPNQASCSYSLNDTDEPVSEQGGSGSLTMTTGAGCAWTAVSNASWLTVTSPLNGNGSGTGPIGYSVVANNSGAQRTGMITARGRTFTVTQPPIQASCTFALNPSSWLYPVEGGTGSFSVMTGAGCFWDANTTYGWITINGGATGVGAGTVFFTVQANNGGSHAGSITVKGQVFTINQCGYVIDPTNASFTSGGGSRSITVSSVAAGCSWSAASNTSWIHITSGASGSGNGSVNYSVDPYDVMCEVRSGTITVAGRTVTITQSGRPNRCCGDPICCADPTACLTTEPPPMAHGLSATGAGTGGLTARYFGNTTLSGQPALERTDATVNFNWAGNSPDNLLPANGFSARWNGQLAAPLSEAYTFYLLNSGGARLRVNNQLVIDRWQPSSEPYTRSAPVELKAGEKAGIRVEYYNAGGQARIHLLWSSASTPRQIILQQYLYPEAATNQPTPTDTNKQSGMLLPPGSDADPKATGQHLSVPRRWLSIPLGRAGLALLIACGVSALLLRSRWRQARRWFAMATAGVMSRLRDQITARLGELFRIVAATYDKLRFVVSFGKKLLAETSNKLNVADFGKRLLAGAFDKLKFVGHFLLAAFLPIFKVVSHIPAVMRLGKQKLAGLLPERVLAIARRALLLWRGLGLGRLKPVLRRALAIAMIVILATPLGPAQADGLARAARATWWTMIAAANRYGASTDGGTFDRLIKALGKRPGKVVSAAAQSEQVTELQVCPTQHVMFVDECYTFTPVALAVNPQDGSKHVVHGAGMSWRPAADPTVAKVSSFGEVEAVGVGTTTVTVQSGSVSTLIQIEVRAGTRPTGSNQQADLDPSDCSGEQASMFAPQSAAGAPTQQSLIGADGVLYDWDPDPAPGSLATDFRNAVGNPRFTATSQSGGGVPTSTQLGSDNYQFNVPVASVGGRGVSDSIDMTLNSRVWNTDDGKLTFNYVGAYPVPGWSMGYGKIIRNYNATATGDGSGVGGANSPGDYLLVSADGTRVRLAAKYDSATGRWFHESDDGSFLKFDLRSGEMRYPDGTRMIYGTVNGCLLPTAMIGTNGGAITMSYRDYCEGNCQRVFRHRTALSAVRDTLGRYVTFHYYGDNDYTADPAQGHPAGELAAIKTPDMDGVQQEVIRVEYQAITLKYDFGGAVVDAPANNSQIQVVRRIYYPQTGKGFLFLDYSTYGMPRKISSRMGMKGSGGAITDGTEIAYTTYNYTTIDPSDPYGRNQDGSLDDFPQFTRREEWWQGKTDASGAPTTDPTRYDYSRATVGTTEEVTVKHVGKNLEEVTTTGTESGQPNFGKEASVELRKSDPGSTLSKQISTYVTGPDGEVEIGQVETIDEEGQGTLLKFGYGHYGRVSDLYECGYIQATGYKVRRHTSFDYIDDQGHRDARFLRLVSRVSIYDAMNNNDDADDKLMGKIETTYDDYVEGIESYGLDSSLYPPNHDAAYDQNNVMRGNATAVKTFSKVAPEAPEEEEATTRRVKYDIFGNLVWAEMSCCVKKFFGLSAQTAYSQPDWVRSGPDSATELNLKTVYHHNYFTGMVEYETNPDGLQTSYEYDGALRLKQVTMPTGAVAKTHFERDGNENDLLTYISQTSYDDQGTTKVLTKKQWFDGSWRGVRAGTGTGYAPTSYVMTAAVYDGWDRVVKQSNPYLGDANGNPQSGVTQFWTVNAYDELSRIIKVTLPDSQFIQKTYNGATTTSGATVITTDTVGRMRKGVMDGLGRLVKVTEQNPANGNLEWETSYSYDVLDNLTRIDQGGQFRTFMRDAKGRLISETAPEAGTTTYTYTDFDAVSIRRDARGVETTYTYGPLNLLTRVSYNNVTGVAPTAPVSIDYRNTSPGKGRVKTVTDGTGNESYAHDNFGRLQSSIRIIDNIRYEKRYEYNEISQMTLMTYPSGKRVKVGRDDRGRLSAVKRVDDSGALLDTYLSGINYRVDGQVSGQNLGDGTTESFEYSDDRLQLTRQKVMKGASTLLDLSYGYGALAGQMGNGSKAGSSGQLVSVTGTINGQGRNQAFTYDNVGRLVTATGWGAWARRFDYDRYGNRTGVWDAVSGGNPLQNALMEQVGGIKTNRITSVNGTAFAYDASGNVTGDGARAYTYDAENRIVSVSDPSSESYGYDASNHRVKKEVGGVVTHYIWEGDKVIAEYERGGGSTQATGTRYYHQDRLSTRVITDSAGNVIGTNDHLPFGEDLGGSGEGEKHKFTTYERDGTGLHYAVNRFYSPQHGRFAQADPIRLGAASLENPQSLNLYSYVQNDPVNLFDPSGLVIAETCFWGPILGWPDAWMAWAGCGGGGGGGGMIRQEENPNRSDKRQKPRAKKGPETKKGRLSKEECKDLIKKIIELTQDLKDRIVEFGLDKLDLRIPGNFYERKVRNKHTGEIEIKKNGLDTHVDEYYKKKDSLENRLQEYDKGRCGNRGGPNSGAVLLAARFQLLQDAYIPDYKTGLKSEADSPALDCCALGLECCDFFSYPRIFVPGVNPTSVPARAAPARVAPVRLEPIRVP